MFPHCREDKKQLSFMEVYCNVSTLPGRQQLSLLAANVRFVDMECYMDNDIIMQYLSRIKLHSILKVY